MNKVVEILCQRDGISYKEALKRVKHVQDLIEHYNYDYDEVESIMLEELGLELDYILDILEV